MTLLAMERHYLALESVVCAHGFVRPALTLILLKWRIW